MSSFLNTKETVQNCLKIIEGFQRDSAWNKKTKRQQIWREKSVVAKEIFANLPIPEISEEEMRKAKIHGVSGRKVYWWEEEVKFPYEPSGYIKITKGYCTRCGETEELDVDKSCVYCGNYLSTKLSSKRVFTDSGRIAKLYTHNDTVYCVLYRVERTIEFVKKGRYLKYGFEPVVTYCSYPRDVYVLTGERPFQMSAWEQISIMGTKSFNGGSRWYFKDNTAWPWGAEILPFDERMLYNTEFKHAHLAEFMQSIPETDDSKAVAALRYLKLYKKYPNIENLVTNGFSNWVVSIINDSKYRAVFNLEAKKMKDITGLDRAEQARAKTEGWTVGALDVYKAYRDKRNKKLPEAVIKSIAAMELKKVKEHTEDILSLALYLVKQNKQPQYWLDYIRMAEKLEYDLQDKAVKYPYNLEKAHDSAVEKTEFLENKDLVEKFHSIAEKLEKINFNNGTYAVVIPKRERELIVEGKILSHCVGGYGKSHCEGQSIFFIRKAEDINVPWYTLQVDLKTGMQIQLHGYKNDRETPIPQEVRDFVKYWLDNIFKPFDVGKMQFIKQKKAAATA